MAVLYFLTAAGKGRRIRKRRRSEAAAGIPALLGLIQAKSHRRDPRRLRPLLDLLIDEC